MPTKVQQDERNAKQKLVFLFCVPETQPVLIARQRKCNMRTEYKELFIFLTTNYTNKLIFICVSSHLCKKRLYLVFSLK